MALIYPFKGFFYNKAVVADFHRVVTQPYDKTSPAMQDEYYQRSPYNVVRITLNLEKRSDPNTGYPDAGAALRQWIDDEVLRQDSQPAIYPYYQDYSVEGERRRQRGFITLLDLRDSGSAIIPHEHTLAAPKQDRLQLMRSTEANEDLIYMLYNDETLAIDRIMDACIAGKQPVIELTDEFDATHRIWSITDPQALAEIQEIMRSQNLFIADGHHRFETSVNFMKECAQKGWIPDELESFDKRMVTCFNSSSGVTILATHRLVRDLPGFNAGVFLKNLSADFAVESIATAEELWQAMKEGRNQNVFGFYPGNNQFFLLRLNRASLEDPIFQQHSKAYRTLDVSILHALILNRHLGIDEKKLAEQTNIDYARSREACIQRVDAGSYQAAFILNPTTAAQMQSISLAGERMPQKSTDFFPKLLTGLVFMKMKIKK